MTRENQPAAPKDKSGLETSNFASRAVRAPRVTSDALLAAGNELIIEHAGKEYRLRLTSNGKLILTA